MKFFSSLATTIASITAAFTLINLPVQAASFSSFSKDALKSSDGFSFDRDTVVRFNFIESHGANKSRFGVFQQSNLTNGQWLFTEILNRNPGSGNGNDSLGTCPTSVQPCTNQFTFKAGVTYLLGLEEITDGSNNPILDANGNPVRIYSNNPLNNNENDPRATRPGMGFYTGSLTFPTSFRPPFGDKFKTIKLDPGAVGIRVNDSWTGDMDANDFVLTAKTVPEPATLAGLGVVAGSLLVARRRRKGIASA